MRRVQRFMLQAAGAVALAALHGGVAACGVCIDDKVAAAYDHAVVISAVDRHRVVVFAEVSGPREAKFLVGAAARAAAAVRGIERSSVRSAIAPAVVSFVLDPAVSDPPAALAAVEKGAAPGVRLTLLKVLAASAGGRAPGAPGTT